MATIQQSMRHALLFYSFLLLFAACGGSDSDFRYVAIGASDAAGIGASPLTNGYVFQIEDGLDEQCGSTQLINLGVPGAETDVVEDVELPLAVEANPDIVTIWTGSNDLVSGRTQQAFETDVRDILATLQQESNAITFIATLPALYDLPRFQEEPDPDVTPERVAAFNLIISRASEATGATLIDLASVPLSDLLVSDDGFHPNDTGHRLIGNKFLEQMVPRICPTAVAEQ